MKECSKVRRPMIVVIVQLLILDILDIDGPVPLGDVVTVYDACHAAGFHHVSFPSGLHR